MGVGPAVAIPAAVKAAGLEIEDIDLFELNEVCSVVSITFFLSYPMLQLLMPDSSVCRPLHLSLCIAATSWGSTGQK
jgi:hypothetical protein